MARIVPYVYTRVFAHVRELSNHRKRKFPAKGFLMATAKKASTKRELIDTGTDKRYVRRNEKGQFDEVDDVGRSLSQDVRRKAKTVVKPGQGDKGDQKRRSSK
jgi:hypothetical protein